jgi:ABC-type multidrug transport system fused ATPase/permease subunit
MWNGQILIVILNLGTLAYGGHLVISNRLDVSNFVSFILYQQRLGDILDVNICKRKILLRNVLF